jgi:hypothetical protein
MHDKRLITIFAALLIFFCLASEGNAQTNSGGKKSPEPCPDEKVYTGKYRNWHFGFSIIIPAGLKGNWNSLGCSHTDDGCVCFPDHGRIVPLAYAAKIEAYTGYEALGWSVREYEKNYIADLKKNQRLSNVEVLSSKSIRLDKLRARRYIVQYVERNRSFIEERIIVLHKGVEYLLSLGTPIERYRKDRHTFEKVRRSWRLTPWIE